MSGSSESLGRMTPQIPGFDLDDVPLAAGRLRVAAGGAGPPVLLLHGFPQTHLAWRAVAPLLAERFRVVCPDLPGYGASPPVESYAKRTTAAAMVALMRPRELSPLSHDHRAGAPTATYGRGCTRATITRPRGQS